MKNFFYISLLLMILYSSLLSITFPDYIENLQEKSPKKAIEWFKKNGYSDKYGVNRYVFDFYRGVNRYLSFIKFQGSRTEVNKASSDFRQALELQNDPIYSYKDRALLYLAGILAVLPGDKELPARIFKYYADNCKTSDINYATAIYWCMYLSYITPIVYENYYESLKILSRNIDNTIYDYFSGENKSINEMLKKLKAPNDMSQNIYEWTTSNMDVYILIKNSIPILPEEYGLLEYTSQQFETFYRYAPDKELEEIKDDIEIDVLLQEDKELIELQDISKNEKLLEKNSNRKIKSMEKDIVNEIVIDDLEIFDYKTNVLNEKNNNTLLTNNEILYTLNIAIDKNPNNGPIKVDIENYSFKTEVSTNFVIEVSDGNYEAYIYFADKLYTNNINVEKDKYNLFSIKIEDGLLENNNFNNIENDLNKETNNNYLYVTIANETTPVNIYNNNAKNNRDIIREVLKRPSKVATEWFNTNPYNEYMGISVEEYAYYRGVAYYSRFLSDRTSSFAAQAKSDLTFAYNKKDNSNLLMRTRLYLGAINLFAYNDLYEADKMFTEVYSSLSENDRYYPTTIYWRARIGIADDKTIENFINILSKEPTDTKILDYSSSMFFKDLLSMPSYRDKIKGIKAVKNTKPIYPPPSNVINALNIKTQLN